MRELDLRKFWVKGFILRGEPPDYGIGQACIGILVPSFIGYKILSHLRTLHLSFILLQIGANYDALQNCWKSWTPCFYSAYSAFLDTVGAQPMITLL